MRLFTCLSADTSPHPSSPPPPPPQLCAEQPSWVCGAPLQPHQLTALDWLRTMWVNRLPAVLADEPGLGKTASTIAFMASLLKEFHVTSPLLIVAPQSMLECWEGALPTDTVALELLLPQQQQQQQQRGVS